MACFVTLKAVLSWAAAELCSGVNVLSDAALAVLLLPISISTWVQQVAPNWTMTWLSRTCRPMSRISPVPFLFGRFPKTGEPR